MGLSDISCDGGGQQLLAATPDDCDGTVRAHRTEPEMST